MSTLHEKLYAYLVGQVDEAITVLENIIAEQAFDVDHAVQVKRMLEKALLKAEDMYIEYGEEDEGEDGRTGAS